MLYYMGFQKPVFYGKERAKNVIKFVEKRKVWFTISIVVIVIGLGSIVYNVATGNEAFNYSIEFKGGTSTEIQFSENYTMDEFNADRQAVKDAILAELQKQFGSDFIIAVNFSEVTVV